MKIDFHTHSKLAKKLPFSKEYTNWLLREAKKAGLDAICITEHFNTIGFEEIYDYIMENYPKDGDTFIVEGVRIFCGMEVDIKEGGHTLVIGKVEDIVEMNRILEPHKDKSTFLPLEDVLALVKQYPVIYGAAHPYRDGGSIPTLSNDLLAQFDFFDANGKDVSKDRGNVEIVGRLADKFDAPVVAGSDTHQAFQYGCIWNRFYEECNTVSALKSAMLAGAYEIEISNHASFQVKTATTLKSALKEIHSLGGDYVAVLTGVE